MLHYLFILTKRFCKKFFSTYRNINWVKLRLVYSSILGYVRGLTYTRICIITVLFGGIFFLFLPHRVMSGIENISMVLVIIFYFIATCLLDPWFWLMYDAPDLFWGLLESILNFCHDWSCMWLYIVMGAAYYIYEVVVCTPVIIYERIETFIVLEILFRLIIFFGEHYDVIVYDLPIILFIALLIYIVYKDERGWSVKKQNPTNTDTQNPTNIDAQNTKALSANTTASLESRELRCLRCYCCQKQLEGGCCVFDKCCRCGDRVEHRCIGCGADFIHKCDNTTVK